MLQTSLPIRLPVVLMCGLLLYGCDNYQTGYQDGYGRKSENIWIILDRAGYKQGYHAGQAGIFQSEWVIENTYENDGLQCRDIIVKADPLMFLPNGYHKATADIYLRKQ